MSDRWAWRGDEPLAFGFRTMSLMKRLILLSALLVCALVARGQAPVVVPAFRQADNVAVITIEGVIDSTTEFSVRRRLSEVEQSGADAVVFELDTPGGEVGAVLEICNLIKSSTISNTVAWINPDAYSGGAIIALACREIVVSTPSSFGDALPVVITMNGMVRATEAMPAAKILPPLLAEVTDSARLRGWDEYLVQALVAEGVELWLVERAGSDPPERYCIDESEYRALFGTEPPRGLPILQAQGADAEFKPMRPGLLPASGGADGEGESTAFRPASPRLAEILAESKDGKDELDFLELTSDRPDFSGEDGSAWTPVGYATDGSSAVVLRSAEMRSFGFSSATIRNDTELLSFFGGKHLSRVDANWSEGLVRFLTNPIVRGLLIATFLIAMFIELTHPGVALPGAVAVAALVLGVAPAMLIGLASWWELAAVGIGVVLIGMEIFVIPGFGVFGISGLLCVFGGLTWTFVGSTGGLFPDSPTDRTNLLYGLTTVFLAMATAGVAFYFLPKKLHELPVFKKLVLSDDADDGGEAMLSAMPAPAGHALRVGDEGVADSPLIPVGRGRFGDEVVDVRASFGMIDAGLRVRIVSVTGMTPEVELAEDEPGSGGVSQEREDA